MDLIFAPWRSAYIKKNKSLDEPGSKVCVFCKKFNEENDAENHIVARFNHCALMLNRYPYNAGHLLILPFEHKAGLCDISQDARAEMMEVTNKSVDVIKQVLKATAANVGINLGKSAGGSLSEHLHIHIVPRWEGDTNFFTTTGDTKVISTTLDEVYEMIKKGFN